MEQIEKERLILALRKALRETGAYKIFDANDFFKNQGFEGTDEEKDEIIWDAMEVDEEYRKYYREQRRQERIECENESKNHEYTGPSREDFLKGYNVQKWAEVLEKFDEAVDENRITSEKIDFFFNSYSVPMDFKLRTKLLYVYMGITGSHTDDFCLDGPLTNEEEYIYAKRQFDVMTERYREKHSKKLINK